MLASLSQGCQSLWDMFDPGAYDVGLVLTTTTLAQIKLTQAGVFGRLLLTGELRGRGTEISREEA